MPTDSNTVRNSLYWESSMLISCSDLAFYFNLTTFLAISWASVSIFRKESLFNLVNIPNIRSIFYFTYLFSWSFISSCSWNVFLNIYISLLKVSRKSNLSLIESIFSLRSLTTFRFFYSTSFSIYLNLCSNWSRI